MLNCVYSWTYTVYLIKKNINIAKINLNVTNYKKTHIQKKWGDWPTSV
jgi:hypothetical protein